MKIKTTSEIIQKLGLTPKEYEDIKTILDREPSYLELSIFAVMWSEHCSYKSSKIYLKNLPTTAPWVIQGPGENAGIIDIGDGMAIAFKIESHNHPSYIEPFQGAATGVGGILRDIFTMGARPLAILNSLRFGELDYPRTRYLLDGVVRGIAAYGNCVGVPTIGGETYFNSCYNGNILVNAFALGLMKRGKVLKGIAKGKGNPVFYVGSKTGRDGIHGATMASDKFEEATEEKRPTVQVGDPFTEKLLMEACLEISKEDYVIGLQDMGAAGLTCSTLEMANRGDMGMEIDLDLVPCREKEMAPFEIMLSESQERMLVVIEKGSEQKLIDIFNKWDLEVVAIGEVIEEQVLILKKGQEILSKLPIKPLTSDAPILERPWKEPLEQKDRQTLNQEDVSEPTNYNDTFIKVLSSPNIINKSFIFEQYDHLVRTNTILLPGGDAGVIRIKGTKKGLAMSVDCNSLHCYLDPFEGAMCAVAESARNVVCVGARPLAFSDCLNFGNPERPETMWQFKEAIRGLTEAAKQLDTPVISGNVSLYNETIITKEESGTKEDLPQGIYPTPVIAMVGLLEDVNNLCSPWFKDQEDIIMLLGDMESSLGGSEYLRVIHNRESGKIGRIDLKKEKAIQSAVLEGIEKKIIKSAHDISEGGLLIAIAESCIISENNVIGADIYLDEEIRKDVLLFGESPSRVMISLDKDNLDGMKEIIKSKNISAKIIGNVGGDKLLVNISSKLVIEKKVSELSQAWRKNLFDKNVLQS